VTVDADGKVTAIGVALSDSALINLPATPPPGMPGPMYNLALPDVAQTVGFDHVTFGWNPLGHDPVQIYGLPHFDFILHRQFRRAARDLSRGCAVRAKLAHRPADQFVPASYIQFPGGVP